ncbi:tetratricopeptide repeat-containing diguanylate cyclase [Natronospira bacteriovora]|uniref:diguanylate cyclase n=1 Tax=Natronospira bacteriovora TaxID=3069753 RepID=A0ABU0W7J9_9GAMM|nr:diguanylate cyclase [Natronospira sp. AB-CW4]MDQ2069966.1 diguanylate cyclase [Natronospira sp. AB-CW4]
MPYRNGLIAVALLALLCSHSLPTRAQSGTEVRINVLLEQSREVLDGQPGLAADNARQALLLAREHQRRLDTGRALYRLGRALQAQGELADALLHFREAEEFIDANQESDWQARLLVGKGAVLTELGDYQQALAYQLDALRLYRDLAAPQEVVEVLNNMGALHFRLGDLDASLTHFQQARAEAESARLEAGLASAINNIGVIHRNRQQLDEAEAHYLASLAIRERIDERSGISASLNNLAIIAYDRGDLDTSQDYHERALAMNRNIGDRYAIARSLHNLGQIMVARGDLEAAEPFFLDSIEINREIGARNHLMGTYEQIADLYHDMDRPDDAFAFLRRYITLREELHNENSRRQIGELRALFEVEQREQEIKLLQERQRTGTILRNGLIVGTFGLLLIIALLFNRYRLKSRSSRLIEARNRELESLDRIVATLNTENDFSHMLSRVLEEALSFFRDADRGVFLVKEGEMDRYRVAVYQGYRYAAIGNITMEGETARRRYTDGGLPLVHGVRRFQNLPPLKGHEALKESDPQKAMVVMDIALDGEADGFLILQSTRNHSAFGQADAERFQRFRRHAISAFRNARQMTALERENERAENALKRMTAAQEELRRLARTDTLTTLPNRRAAEEWMKQEAHRVRRHQRPLTVALADIDHFKRINDELGHDAGDEVLKAVAEKLSRRVRNEDLVARWGGEEFLLLLPETDLAGGESLANNLRTLVTDSPLMHEGKPISISVTFGLALFSPGESLHDTLKRADAALYQGKAMGRNRVITEVELADD